MTNSKNHSRKRSNNKLYERRRHKGMAYPLLYLSLEVIAMVLAFYMVSHFGFFLLDVAALLFLLYFFMTSSLPRFRRAIERQRQLR
jgi:hypothetical protein